MISKYHGLTPKEADDLMIGLIGVIVCAELDTARRMTPAEWEERDIFEWSHSIASAIYDTIENRRKGAP
ncbi:hypothetical protein GFM14_37365 [Rhizobium leguminosarum bv. viciae]|uniref:hypothetical protein n=1 Tax=Rhizobium leguminosarum TaxID=384 RepID=UPI00140FA846|nr:hypothetical protein [Rhizobium leguminosarum]NKJ97102.1 hypothetical protein [Rhizobium leguminosarum bv. viciae]QIO58193.1 hypothetical protein HA463_11060 [Rhizobium leguminosarum bv. trifolii]